VLWSESFGAPGASITGFNTFGADNTGGLAFMGVLDGTVDFGCGAITSASAGSTLLASFDDTGAVRYVSTVVLPTGVAGLAPVVDGLGGISYAVQLASGNVLVTHYAP
jgi:hypothetical protein